MSTYKYKAEVERVIDGDTVRLKVDLGFRLTYTDNFRLIGIDAPEMRGEDFSRGVLAQKKLEDKLKEAKVIHAYISKRRGKYRWLCRLETDNHLAINQWLLDNGYVEEYGKK